MNAIEITNAIKVDVLNSAPATARFVCRPHDRDSEPGWAVGVTYTRGGQPSEMLIFVPMISDDAFVKHVGRMLIVGLKGK